MITVNTAASTNIGSAFSVVIIHTIRVITATAPIVTNMIAVGVDVGVDAGGAVTTRNALAQNQSITADKPRHT